MSNSPVDPTDPDAATRILWNALERPIPVADAARALFGLSSDATTRLMGVSVATSDEASALLEAMPEILRNLAITTVQTSERCQGEVRGPILWSETMAARAGTAGSTDVFVCLTARRAYDTPQNRILVAALAALRRAATVPESDGTIDRTPTADLDRIRQYGDEARRFLEHRTLRDVSAKRPSRRDLAKTSVGRRSRQYAPATELLAKVRDPIGIDDLVGCIDPRTARQHRALVALATRLRRLGAPVGRFRVTPGGELRAGDVVYRHRSVAQETRNPLHGILVGRLLIDVPDELPVVDDAAAAESLAERAHGRTAVLISTQADVERAADLIAGRPG